MCTHLFLPLFHDSPHHQYVSTATFPYVLQYLRSTTRGSLGSGRGKVHIVECFTEIGNVRHERQIRSEATGATHLCRSGIVRHVRKHAHTRHVGKAGLGRPF